MAERPTPEEIRRATFRVVFRGFDQGEVGERLDRLATLVERLTAERDRLAQRLGEFADRDLKTEFESIGREVTAVLEAARAAAEAMRERATADAARWRSEAMAEVEALRRDARSDAESLRSDAWTTGTSLLESVQAEVDRQRAETERLALAIRGEAEREAHRLTASARREADDVLRSAKMEAERMVAQARVDHDEIIAGAHRQAEAAQERARALEERRRDLLEELESVRAALAAVETELEERRQGIGLSEPPELPTRMVISSEEGTEVKDWEEGRTVRVIRPARAGEDEASLDDTTDADRLAEEVARLHSRDESSGGVGGRAEDEEEAGDAVSPAEAEGEDEPPPEPVFEAPTSAPVPSQPEPEPEPVPDDAAEEPAPEAAPEGEEERGETEVGADELSELFRRLRRPPEQVVEPHPETPADRPVGHEAEKVDDTSSLPEGVDPFETRERLLLPITNATLRAVKRGLANAQNQALESLRVNQGEWAPDVGELDAALREDLDTLVDQASQAGVEAAIEMGMTGLGSLNPQPPPPDEVGRDLIGALTTALETAGSGSRERQAAVSRIFRGWRTDEAERRIRSVALVSYHAALRQALESQERTWQWVAAGRLCPSCRQAAESREALPPAHRDCQCTIVPA